MRRGNDFTDNCKKDFNYRMPDGPRPFIYANKGGCHGTVLSCHENRQTDEKYENLIAYLRAQKKNM